MQEQESYAKQESKERYRCRESALLMSRKISSERGPNRYPVGPDLAYAVVICNRFTMAPNSVRTMRGHLMHKSPLPDETRVYERRSML